MNDKMEIVYAFDKNYLKYFNMSVDTLLKFNPNAHVTVVSTEPLDIPYDNIIIPIDENVKHRENDTITDSTYLRLKLTQLPYDKIIYIDADVLCLKPLDELWNMECDYINLAECHLGGIKNAKEHKHEKYGLAGMMVMNLKALREDNFTKKAFTPFDYSIYSKWFHDQTIINHYFYDKLTFVDTKYNYCFERRYKKPLPLKNIVLLHFPSSKKENMAVIYKLIINNKI